MKFGLIETYFKAKNNILTENSDFFMMPLLTSLKQILYPKYSQTFCKRESCHFGSQRVGPENYVKNGSQTSGPVPILVLLCGFHKQYGQERLRKAKVAKESELDPWTLFLNAMRAPMTRDRYQTRVAKFFDFIGIRGKTLEPKSKNLRQERKQ